MFQNCGSLNYITAYATELEIDADNPSSYNTCSANWVKGVANTGTFKVNSSFTDDQISACNFFSQNDASSFTLPSSGTTVNEDEYMGHNTGVCWSIGTGGIHEGWTVTK